MEILTQIWTFLNPPELQQGYEMAFFTALASLATKALPFVSKALPFVGAGMNALGIGQGKVQQAPGWINNPDDVQFLQNAFMEQMRNSVGNPIQLQGTGKHGIPAGFQNQIMDFRNARGLLNLGKEASGGVGSPYYQPGLADKLGSMGKAAGMLGQGVQGLTGMGKSEGGFSAPEGIGMQGVPDFSIDAPQAPASEYDAPAYENWFQNPYK